MHVAVNAVIPAPLSAPGVKITLSLPVPTLVAMTSLGRAGRPAMSVGAVAADGRLAPRLFLAVTRKR